MASGAAPMDAIHSAAHGVADGAGEARNVVEMGATLCPDDGLGIQVGGAPLPMPAAMWSSIATVLVAVIWLSRGLPSRHARSPGPTRQAILQRFQL
ncbi:MAG: hypothetical protein ACRD1H_03250 [Vicinamibacterales bacterium]